MFYAPKTVASMVAALNDSAYAEESKFYSDFHKDAIGCRPRKSLPECRVEAAVEVARLEEWREESERIAAMRIEVARFDLSRSMEYLQRRGDADSPKEAFQIHLMQVLQSTSIEDFLEEIRDWDWVCYKLGLPYEDAPALKAFWEAHS